MGSITDRMGDRLNNGQGGWRLILSVIQLINIDTMLNMPFFNVTCKHGLKHDRIRYSLAAGILMEKN